MSLAAEDDDAVGGTFSSLDIVFVWIGTQKSQTNKNLKTFGFCMCPTKYEQKECWVFCVSPKGIYQGQYSPQH